MCKTVSGWCLVLMVLALPSAVLADRQTEVDGTPIEDRIYRGYEANWRKYARFACEVDGGYAYIPHYDRRKDSSRGMSVTQVMDELTKRWEEKSGNLVVKKTKRPPREDAEAFARAIPDLAVGSYGWVASAEVVEVIGRDEMIVKELWLVDRDRLNEQYKADREKMERRTGEVDEDELKFDYQGRLALREQAGEKDEGFTGTFRLIGYDTRGLREGERWEGRNNEGFQVAVIRWETPEPEAEEDSDRRRRSRSDDDPRLVLSEIESKMRRTLDSEGFKKLLAERGMSVVEFVELVRDMRENDRQNAEERITNALLPDALPDDD